MADDDLVTHPSVLDKSYVPTFNEAARGQQSQQQEEGSQQVKRTHPEPTLEPDNEGIRRAVDWEIHGQRMADDHERTLEENAQSDKQQESDDRQSLQDAFWKAKMRAHAVTPFQRAADPSTPDTVAEYLSNRRLSRGRSEREAGR